MSRSQCVCGDCAEAMDHISIVESGYSTQYQATEDNEDTGFAYGDLVDDDYTGPKDEVYVCDECAEVFEYESDAEECCVKWECNFCGWHHANGTWSNGKENAATCCAQTCDECEAYGWPDFLAEHSCNSGMGERTTLPWEDRGIKVNAHDSNSNWKTAWELDPENLNPVQAAADYYMLEAIKAGLVGTTDGKGVVNRTISDTTSMQVIMSEAAEMFDSLVQTWDPILQRYTHMAVGGELRHHRAVGNNVLNGNRDTAWVGWKLIFEAVGPDSLTDAADLFNEFDGGSFGGEPWANACLILHKRVTGAISPALFLDRIFNAQHNGGCLLNKVTWAGDKGRYSGSTNVMQIHEMQQRLLPAHGASPEPDYPTLLAYASHPVRALYRDAHKVARSAAIHAGLPITDLVTAASVGRTERQEYAYRKAKQQAKATAYAKMPKSEKLQCEIRKYEKNLVLYQGYADAEVAEAEAFAAGTDHMPCACGDADCQANKPKFSYYQNVVKSYKKELVSLKAQKADALKAEKAGANAPAEPEYTGLNYLIQNYSLAPW